MNSHNVCTIIDAEKTPKTGSEFCVKILWDNFPHKSAKKKVELLELTFAALTLAATGSSTQRGVFASFLSCLLTRNSGSTCAPEIVGLTYSEGKPEPVPVEILVLIGVSNCTMLAGKSRIMSGRYT